MVFSAESEFYNGFNLLMKRCLSYFSPKMPIYVGLMIQKVKYHPDEFLTWYCRFPQLSEVRKNISLAIAKKTRWLIVWGYYFWLVYIVSAFAVFQIAPIAGLIGLLISPFVVAGAMYAVIYTVWLAYTQPKQKRKLKKTSRKKPNHKTDT